MNKQIFLSLFLFMVILATGCQNNSKEPEMKEEGMEESEAIEVDKETGENETAIEVELINQEGVSVGAATLTEETDGVHIAVSAHHLPEGLHGFHIHEKGICETPTFESAGGHFNPEGKNHGFDNPEGAHAGDMANLEVKADGMVEQTIVNEQVTLEKGEVN